MVQGVKMKEEQGIWIVYDLEANRKIQELLISNKFKFIFVPNLDVLKKMKKGGANENH